MERIFYHIIIPALMPTAFLTIAAMSVDVLGCRMRGLVAVILALSSAVAALVTTIIDAKLKVQGKKKYAWWLLSTTILVVPPISLLILA